MPLRIRVMYLLAAGVATVLMAAHSQAGPAGAGQGAKTSAPAARGR